MPSSRAAALAALVLTLAVVGLALSPPSLPAQDVSGNLEGSTLDTAGAPIAGVEVIVTGTGLPGRRMATTDRRGHFRLEQLPVGTYEARYRLVGYRPVRLTGLVVRLGTTIAAPTVRLPQATVELEELTATTDRPLLNPSSAAGGGNLTAEHFDDLPTDRNYRNLLALLPGMNAEKEGVNVEGASGTENQFYVDGANVTDMNLGTTSMLLPPNFVEEVQVRSGGYEAEYRGTLGGVADVVTRSGGDRFEGQIFSTATGNGLTGTPRTAGQGTSQGDFLRYDVGGSLGGPLVRGRLWFFGAYSRFEESDEVVIPGNSSRDARRMHNSFAAKFTWQPGPRTTVITSLLGDPTTEHLVGGWDGPIANVDPLLGRATSGMLSGTMNATYLAGPQLTLKGTASWVHQRYDEGAATARGAREIFFADTNNLLSGGYPTHESYRWTNTRKTLALSASYAAGVHQLKGGLEYTEQSYDQDLHFLQAFQSTADSRHPTPYYVMFTFNAVGATESRLPSAFIQDGWRPDRHLTLNLGLRWDGQYLIGSDGHISLAIKDQWQPRLGVVFRPDAEGRHRIFAAYGRFYQEFQQNMGGVYFAYGSNFGFAECAQDPRVDLTSCAAPGTLFVRRPDPGLRGQSYDEWSGGYERALSRRVTGRARVVRRHFNWGVEDSWVLGQRWTLGNPGRGELSAYPRMRRDYTGLELSADGALTSRLWIMASYVLSRTKGNYGGLYNVDGGYAFSNTSGDFDTPVQLIRANGLLPQDRTHVFKLNASCRLPVGFTAGTIFVVESGIPRNQFGWIDGGEYPSRELFLVQRGSAGRTPTIWDLNLRFSWALDQLLHTSWQPTLLLDLYHVASRKQITGYDDRRYFDGDTAGVQSNPNSNYGNPTAFQPPMAARLGLTVNF